MLPGPPGHARDLAQIRLDNALALFEEFVRATARHADAATLRGLERRFAERIDIQPSYWSQIKSRARQIGERLARQFEQRCHKPPGWLDRDHASTNTTTGGAAPELSLKTGPSAGTTNSESTPKDDDERFIVGLVLTYYRRHPQRARTRLLDLLGEVSTPNPGPLPTTQPGPAGANQPLSAAAEDAHDLWQRTQAGVAPLKRKK